MGLEQVELVLDIEEAFGIKIGNDDDYGQRASTVGDFYDVVLRHVRQLSRPPSDAEVWRQVVACSVRHGYGLTADQVSRDTRFVADLGYG